MSGGIVVAEVASVVPALVHAMTHFVTFKAPGSPVIFSPCLCCSWPEYGRRVRISSASASRASAWLIWCWGVCWIQLTKLTGSVSGCIVASDFLVRSRRSRSQSKLWVSVSSCVVSCLSNSVEGGTEKFVVNPWDTVVKNFVKSGFEGSLVLADDIFVK